MDAHQVQLIPACVMGGAVMNGALIVLPAAARRQRDEAGFSWRARLGTRWAAKKPPKMTSTPIAWPT